MLGLLSGERYPLTISTTWMNSEVQCWTGRGGGGGKPRCEATVVPTLSHFYLQSSFLPPQTLLFLTAFIVRRKIYRF